MFRSKEMLEQIALKFFNSEPYESANTLVVTY